MNIVVFELTNIPTFQSRSEMEIYTWGRRQLGYQGYPDLHVPQEDGTTACMRGSLSLYETREDAERMVAYCEKTLPDVTWGVREQTIIADRIEWHKRPQPPRNIGIQELLDARHMNNLQPYIDACSEMVRSGVRVFVVDGMNNRLAELFSGQHLSEYTNAYSG